MTRLIRRIFFLLAFVLGGFFVLPAASEAQPFGKTVLVVAQLDDISAALEGASELERELVKQHVPLISMHDARDRFLARSRPPQAPSASDLDTLGRYAQQALEHVAFGRSVAAEQSVRQIVALAERSLESLNRETATARQLLDACLALVRASAHDGKRDLAIEQAMHCRRLVPDLSPNENSHPANVIGVLAEADDQLRRMRVGSLRVQTRDGRACDVYLNGRHLGTTPFALERAAVGEYRVQVECETDNPGRVHSVQLGDEPAELTVDLRLDATVVTEPRLALHYSSEAELRANVIEHSVQLGRELRAEEVLLWNAQGARSELLRVQVRHRRLVAAVALERASRQQLGTEALSRALEMLVQGRFVEIDRYRYGSVDPAGESHLSMAVAPYTIRTIPDDARLLLDGSAVLRGADNVLPLRLGAHVLEVRSDGYRSSVRDLHVRDISPQHVEVVLSPLVDSAPPQAKPLRRKWWFWTTLGAVVAGGVTAGLVLGLKERGGGGGGAPTIDVPDEKAR